MYKLLTLYCDASECIFDRLLTWFYGMAIMIGCIWHALGALQGTRAKPGNHLVLYKRLGLIYIGFAESKMH